jgi:hypothetical protein
MWHLFFVRFGSKNLAIVQNFIHNFSGNPNSPQENKPFFPNIYKLHNLYLLMNFYLILLREDPLDPTAAMKPP